MIASRQGKIRRTMFNMVWAFKRPTKCIPGQHPTRQSRVVHSATQLTLKMAGWASGSKSSGWIQPELPVLPNVAQSPRGVRICAWPELSWPELIQNPKSRCANLFQKPWTCQAPALCYEFVCQQRCKPKAKIPKAKAKAKCMSSLRRQQPTRQPKCQNTESQRTPKWLAKGFPKPESMGQKQKPKLPKTKSQSQHFKSPKQQQSQNAPKSKTKSQRQGSQAWRPRARVRSGYETGTPRWRRRLPGRAPRLTATLPGAFWSQKRDAKVANLASLPAKASPPKSNRKQPRASTSNKPK